MADSKRRVDFHERYQAHGEERTSSDRSFGLTFAVIFLLIAGYQAITAGLFWAAVFGVGAIALCAVSFLCPSVLSPANRVWTRLGLLLHRVMNPIIMGFMFFLVFTPMGFVMRLFGFDPLARRLRQQNPMSYWKTRDPAGPPRETMKHQF